MNRKYKILLAFTSVLAICLMILLGLSMSGALPALSGTDKSGTAAAEDIPESLSHEGYTLEKVVVLSRHNIRSPLSGGDSILGTITPHEWFEWTSAASQLSVRGGALETCMGQYFRKWLEDEGLFPENYQPEEEAVRIYANAKQRTVATARFFTSAPERDAFGTDE